jgi:general secretion pathway protein N
MKRWSMVAVGLTAWIIALVATAPATMVDAVLDRASQGRLRLAEAEGSFWSGSGQIEIRDAAGRTGVSRDLVWRVVPLSLFRGHLLCEVGLGLAAKRFPVRLSWSRVELDNADLTVPAAVLGVGVPKLAPLGLTGDVMIHVTTLSLARDAMDGTATLQWRAAGSSLTPVSPLGDYELRLDGEGKMIHAYLRTIEGPLRLDGKGSWRRGDNPAFAATASVPSEFQKDLAPLLRLIAIERGAGRFELQLK